MEAMRVLVVEGNSVVANAVAEGLQGMAAMSPTTAGWRRRP